MLFLREYLSVTGMQVQREMYSYHYQDATQQLCFRYDNARHRPRLATREHKHTPKEIIEGVAPTLAEVLHEVVALLEMA
ncbi:MAG: hypothetical protein EI684_05565 [Candidatus Viridilinea halotolerans]|uniref:Uncharacterized protein n=1 Tax=Candidatus Viridilinea halotolerans TaxID=2491704 RepID=A0A426U555_9CHLR|nr:MAG: hypothetical protein EI684_05565 [Candidatus Viridilinea halotolerans]